MFTQDYLMRMINQVLAALMTSLGLRKAGKYSEAMQGIDQAVEQLTTLPANLIDQMDDAAVLSTLTFQGQLETGRLALLADLYQEKGEIQSQMDPSAPALFFFSRALRFMLEAVLSDDNNLSPENIARIESLYMRLKDRDLPVDTLLALSDYYQRLLEKEDQFLASVNISRQQVNLTLTYLQERFGPSQTPISD